MDVNELRFRFSLLDGGIIDNELKITLLQVAEGNSVISEGLYQLLFTFWQKKAIGDNTILSGEMDLPFMVDYSLNYKQLFELGSISSGPIIPTDEILKSWNYSRTSEKSFQILGKLFSFGDSRQNNRNIKSSYAVEIMLKHGYRQANAFELLSFGVRYSDLIKLVQIISIDPVGRYVPILHKFFTNLFGYTEQYPYDPSIIDGRWDCSEGRFLGIKMEE